MSKKVYKIVGTIEVTVDADGIPELISTYADPADLVDVIDKEIVCEITSNLLDKVSTVANKVVREIKKKKKSDAA